MTTILVTGASGLVGSALTPRAAKHFRVVTLSRRAAEGGHLGVIGDFASFEDLRKLDDERIDALVHLASEVGGTTEEAGLSVNVLGARRLIRYLADRGCTRFVMASSIAATGCLAREFVPECLPIDDRHACLARDAYGLSKHMAESLADYFARIVPGACFVSLRFGLAMERVQRGRGHVPWVTLAEPPALPFLYMGYVALDDMVDGILAALAAPGRPGSHVYNLVGPDMRCTDRVADVLRASLGARAATLDLARYEALGRHAPPLYAIDALKHDLGFEPRRSVAETQ
ncbi:MAG: NAD(P)-dependent oxidoreductase [Alphaproteobacteria bacterium]|nr:NAD(P)-dependent oxidoreductase [Alphaproteobacteria bacterium]